MILALGSIVPTDLFVFFFVAIAIDFTSNSDAKKSNEVFVFTFLSMFFVLN